MQAETTILKLFGGSEVDPVADPYSTYERLRKERPAIPLRTLDGRTVCLLTRFEDVFEAFRNHEHLRHRSIIKPALAPKALKGDFRGVVESIANELIDAFIDEGRTDLVSAFTFTYPLQVFCRILGLPVDDYARFHRSAVEMTKIGTDPARGLVGAQELADYLHPVVDERKREPTEDLIGSLVTAEVEGARLTDDEVVSFLRLLVVAGAETTYHLIGSALFALLNHPEQLEECVADRSNVEALINETLRWESPIQLTTRETIAATSIGGVDMPAETGILLAVGSANRDETRFDDPERFDIHRKGPEHIAFGYGRHYCAGAKLANVEAQVALNAIFDRLKNLRLDPDAPEDTGVVGLAFRGPNRLPVRFDA
jgi:cytochrome P450